MLPFLRGAAGLAVVVLLLIGPVLFSPGTEVLGSEHTDLCLQFLPWRQFGFAALARGHWPLWNPHIFGGVPYFADVQSALLYLPNLVFLVLPLAAAANASIALHLWMLGVFTLGWALRRGLSPLAAWVTGSSAMLSSCVVMQVYAGHLTNLTAMTWAPLIFACVEEALSAASERRRRLAWLAAMFGVTQQILAGHPQYVYYTALALAVHTTLRARRARVYVALASVYVAAALLSAAQLLPSVEAARDTLRAQPVPYAFASMFAFPVENLLTAVAPFAFGNDIHLPYWGRWYSGRPPRSSASARWYARSTARATRSSPANARCC